MSTGGQPTNHVDYNPDHDPICFGDTAGQPILSFRAGSTTGARVNGRLIPDGRVLTYEETWCDDGGERAEGGSNPGEYITGISDLTAVDEAVEQAQGWLTRLGYREPGD